MSPKPAVHASSFMCGVECFERAGRIDQRGASVHGDCDAQRFGQLLAAGTGLRRLVAVDRDAAVAAGGDRDRGRDHLARLFVQPPGLRASAGAGHIAPQTVSGVSAASLPTLPSIWVRLSFQFMSSSFDG